MTSCLTIRLPDDLKETCTELARREKMTLNKWIIRSLQSELAHKTLEEDEQELTQCIEYWYEDEYINHNDTTPCPTPDEFRIEAFNEKLMTGRCPSCGRMTRMDKKHCSSCGAKLEKWHLLETAAAHYVFKQYMDEWMKTNAVTGKFVGLNLITHEIGKRRFIYQIAEPDKTNRSSSHVIHTITKEEINEAKKIIPLFKDWDDFYMADDEEDE